MERVTSRDGTSIAFWRSGAGPPLLLVHGITADHTRWASISPRFEADFSVYALDRRGRGGSGDSPGYDIMREAEDVAAAVEAIGGQVSVLGHSYGALCSLEASLLTDGIGRLVVYEPPIPTGAPLYPPGTPDRMQALVDKGDLEAALEIMIREVVQMPDEEFETYRRQPMWNVRVSLAPTIPRELVIDRTYTFDPQRYAGMTAPTLVLLGGESPPPFRGGVEVVAAALPNSRVAILPGQRHIAMDTAPDLFARLVLDFLLE